MSRGEVATSGIDFVQHDVRVLWKPCSENDELIHLNHFVEEGVQAGAVNDAVPAWVEDRVNKRLVHVEYEDGLVFRSRRIDSFCDGGVSRAVLAPRSSY